MSTVSRVLKNTGRASEETRERIFAAARKLEYRANPAARALKTARSSMLLMVVPQIENPVFASAIVAAEIEAREKGYALLVAYDQGRMGSKIIEDVSRCSMIEGVIIASFDDDKSLRQTLATIQQPHVVINRILPHDNDCIAIDTRAAARIGVEHLIDLGHRRIGHMAGRLGRFNGDARHQGWVDAMATAGLEHGSAFVAEAGYDPQRVPHAVDALLAIGVTAIHAATLLTGATAIARLHACGLRVPQDVSVTTMHDDLLARVVHPEVTTVTLPTEEMGRVAVSNLVDRIETPRQSPERARETLLLPPGRLVQRGSSGVPPAEDP